MTTKYIFVTGGVVSGLGKGITAASLGRLLKARGLRVTMQKFDPYINIDPGTMSPYQHGEVFVTDDGAETDLDLGHYERFIDESGNLKETYVRMAVEYIQMNYSRKITISEIADHVRLNRSYLGSIFKEYMNTSLQDYLVNFRINRACELMLDNNLSIGDISRSVGYDDQLLFSKMFKKIKGLPPKEYRKNILTV